MSSRTTLPSTLTSGATLTRSGEGVTFNAASPLTNQVPPNQGLLPAQNGPPWPANLTASTLPARPPVVAATPLVQQGIERPPVVLPNGQAPVAGVQLSPGVTVNGIAAPVAETSAGAPAKKEWGISFNPLNIIWLILIFIIVIIILYSTKPNMVTDLVNGERLINNNKLVLWTVIITIIIAVMAFVIMSMVSRRLEGQVKA